MTSHFSKMTGCTSVSTGQCTIPKPAFGGVSCSIEPLRIIGERRVRNRKRSGIRGNGNPVRCAKIRVCLNDITVDLPKTLPRLTEQIRW